MNRSERTGMAGVEGIEQRACLDSAHFAENDTVGSPAERGPEKIVERNICLEGIGLTFHGQDVRLLDVKLGSILNDDDAFLFRDCIRQNSQKRGLSCASSSADKQGFPTANLLFQKIRKRPRERAASDQVIDGVMAAGELPYRERGRRAHNRRNDRRQATSVRELRVQDGVVFIQPFTKLVGNDFEAGAKPAGVEGKTRLVQALFDGNVGTDALDLSLAVYTNMSDNPDPQPFGFVSDLIAAQSRAVVVVDNCPADLHKRVSELCRSQGSTVNVLTVEYDIQDGVPEGTDVYELRPSSNGVIESLLKARFPDLSLVDLPRIVEFSEGNARIAIALAATVHSNGTLAGLNDRDLFERLFYQRQAPDNSLLMAAEVCSLVYSFNGEDISEQSELALLSAMIGKSALGTYQQVAELRRRDLVQHRSVWRAILPHAIANRLATIALQNIPSATIRQCLVESSPDRLLTSFSRRLGYLHASPEAVAIVKDWFSPKGLLGDAGKLNETGRALLRNVAPVSPEAALTALERAMSATGSESAPHPLISYIGILRSLAYEPGHGASRLSRCFRSERYGVGADCRSDSAGPDAHPQAGWIEEGPAQCRSIFLLDGNEQRKGQHSQERILCTVRHSGRARTSGRKVSTRDARSEEEFNGSVNAARNSHCMRRSAHEIQKAG